MFVNDIVNNGIPVDINWVENAELTVPVDC